MVAMRHTIDGSRSALIRTLREAVARHGWRGLGSKTLGALLNGGPRQLVQSYRSLRSAVSGEGQPAGRLAGQMHRRPANTISRHVEDVLGPQDLAYRLRPDHSMPLRHFNDFLDRWDKHPAIRKMLDRDGTLFGFGYTMVVAKHAEFGLSRLHDTLELAQHLARRAAIDVRVIVFDPDCKSLPDEFASERHDVPCILVDSMQGLRELLAVAPAQDLVHFAVCGDQITPVFAEIVTRSTIPSFDLVLTDMYFVDASSNAFPILLPGLNLIHALNVDYFLSRSLMKAGLAAVLLRDRDELDVHAVTAAALARCTEPGSTLRAYHAAFPLLCVSESGDAIQQRRAACLNRSAPLRLAVESGVEPARTASQSRVSIVICTKNNGFLLEQLVERISIGDRGRLVDIVVVANQITNAYALNVARRLAAERRIKLIDHDRPFNFSAQCNLGAASAEGDVLLFLNDDIVPVNSEWLAELAMPLEEPTVGVVGPLLLYPDQTVQHAGMFLGYNNIAGHTLRGAVLPDGDCAFMASAPRQVMSVTGAALCMRKRDFEALNGFDQNLFALHIQDVDLCLRAHYSGLAVVYNPRSVLLHMESVSVKPTLANPRIGELRGREHEAFLRRWGRVLQSDQFHNPNFSRADEACREIMRPQA
jgi:GT2 family glycosyltransferase